MGIVIEEKLAIPSSTTYRCPPCSLGWAFEDPGGATDYAGNCQPLSGEAPQATVQQLQTEVVPPSLTVARTTQRKEC